MAWLGCAELLDLVLPRECGGCGAPGTRWCATCAAGLAAAAPRAWAPTPSPEGMPPTWAALPYDGPVRAALVAQKDGGRADLERVLSPVLALAITAAVQDQCGRLDHPDRLRVVPAASSRAAARRRGERPVERLVHAAAALAGLAPCRVVPVLRLRRPVADQAGLGATERVRNVRGAVTVPPALREQVRGRAWLVADDVVTSGATLTESARALREAGATAVVAATVAATRRLPPPAIRPLAPPG